MDVSGLYHLLLHIFYFVHTYEFISVNIPSIESFRLLQLLRSLFTCVFFINFFKQK